MRRIVLFLSIFLAGILVIVVVIFNSNSEMITNGKNAVTETKDSIDTKQISQDASKENFIEKEKDEILYLFPADSEQQIEKYAIELKSEKTRFDELLGSEVKDRLTIESHQSFNSPEVFSENSITGGYYIINDSTLHMSMELESWQNILIHEYTHYRTHQFYEMQDLPVNQIPTWFEEGIAEYMAGPLNLMAPSQLETVSDFRKMDSTESFQELQQEGFSPYAQSYFAVQQLVNTHGIEVIPELLKSQTMDAFYDNLERIAQKPLNEFQTDFLMDLIANQTEIIEEFKRVDELIEEGQYQHAENLLLKIRESSLDLMDQSLAETKISEIYLEQGRYSELALKLQNKLDEESKDMRPVDFLTLAELYLIDNPQKALEIIQISKEYVMPEDLFYNQLVEVALPYEQINSDQELTGYRTLIEEDMIFTEEVRKEIVEDLKSKYPNEF
ncbi:peptidase MA family metallohydrolase [Planococcus koreensis]|uniref:peptidase MA family metallohydrolase n=1 Tax=Planococcus koreensis TaxID=112331 RepID=UPI0039FC8CF5